MRSVGFVALFLLLAGVSKAATRQLEFCNRFLACEMEMMDTHKRCTGSSRNATALSCGLMEDFNELSRLMQARVQEFGACVAAESFSLAERESLEEVEIPEAECDRGDQNLTASPRSCWEAVAQIKRRCQTFQACCPAVKSCLRSGKDTPITKAVREKHIVINRKSLECRNRMREILEEKHAHSPKAHGVSIAQMENVVVDGRSSLVPFKRPTPPNAPLRLETTKIRMPLDMTSEKMAAIMKELSRILLGKAENSTLPPVTALPSTITPPTTTFTFPPSTTPSTTLESTTIEGTTQTTTRPPTTSESTTPFFPTTARTQRHHKKKKTTGGPIKDPIRDLVAQKPHYSFALPPSLNLTQLNLPAARPHLQTTTPAVQTPVNVLGGPIVKPTIKIAMVKKTELDAVPPSFRIEADTQPAEGPKEAPVQPPPALKPPPPSSLFMIDGDTEDEEQPVMKQETTPIKWHKPALPLHDSQVDARPRQFAAPRPVENSPLPPLPPTDEREAKLVKLLRRIRLRPEDHKMEMRVRKLRTDHSPTTTTPPPPSSPLPSPPPPVAIEGDTEAEGEALITTSASPFVPPSPLQMRPLPPPLSADTNVDLLGYRHQVLAKRRRVSFDNTQEPTTESPPAHQQADENYVETTGWPIDRRTTIAQALIPLSWRGGEEIRRAPPTKSWLPQPPVVTIDEREAAQIRIELLRNLEEFLERSTYEQSHRRREQLRREEERLAVLRRSRADYESENRTSGYCELFATCSFQLRFVQSTCLGDGEADDKPSVSELFRKKFGSSCNAKLFSEYKATDDLRLQLLFSLEECVVEAIGTGQAAVSPKCPAEWPVLPPFEDSLDCDAKTRLVHDHCARLGKCCDTVKRCRKDVEKDPLFSQLNDAKKALSAHAAKCRAATSSPHSSPQTTTTAGLGEQPTTTATPPASRLI